MWLEKEGERKHTLALGRQSAASRQVWRARAVSLCRYRLASGFLPRLFSSPLTRVWITSSKMLALSSSPLATSRTVYTAPGCSPSITWKLCDVFTASEIHQLPSPGTGSGTGSGSGGGGGGGSRPKTRGDRWKGEQSPTRHQSCRL